MKTIVMSESSDWYIIPIDRLDEWNNSVMFEYEGDEDWVEYLPSPSSIRLIEYTVV